jgi:hypothetical protein
MVIDYWTGAPDWANYIATDADGMMYYYENRPSSATNVWVESEGRIEQALGAVRWRDSLVSRPS